MSTDHFYPICMSPSQEKCLFCNYRQVLKTALTLPRVLVIGKHMLLFTLLAAPQMQNFAPSVYYVNVSIHFKTLL